MAAHKSMSMLEMKFRNTYQKQPVLKHRDKTKHLALSPRGVCAAVHLVRKESKHRVRIILKVVCSELFSV